MILIKYGRRRTTSPSQSALYARLDSACAYYVAGIWNLQKNPAYTCDGGEVHGDRRRQTVTRHDAWMGMGMKVHVRDACCTGPQGAGPGIEAV